MPKEGVATAGPDPDGIVDLAGLARELERLRHRAARGSGRARVSLDVLARRVAVPRSTVHTYVAGRALPPLDVLDAIVIALGAEAAEQRAWAEAWQRVADDVSRRRRATQPGPRSAGSDLVVARQLPPAVTGFVGRTRQLAVLRQLTDAGAMLAVLSGPAGVGKPNPEIGLTFSAPLDPIRVDSRHRHTVPGRKSRPTPGRTRPDGHRHRRRFLAGLSRLILPPLRAPRPNRSCRPFR